jgi:fluoroacetyl-CoA thioesterase
MTELQAGLVFEKEHVVGQADTAARWGSGGLEVYGTPSLVGFLELTAQAGLLPYLEPGQSTVGVQVNIRHLAATPVGMKLHSRVELLAVEGRRLTFWVQAWDEVELISEGEHVRFVIDIEKFMQWWIPIIP